MNRWLEVFPSDEIQLRVMVLPGSIVLLLMRLLVSLQGRKAARLNPTVSCTLSRDAGRKLQEANKSTEVVASVAVSKMPQAYDCRTKK
jgi:hypothetical protein